MAGVTEASVGGLNGGCAVGSGCGERGGCGYDGFLAGGWQAGSGGVDVMVVLVTGRD